MLAATRRIPAGETRPYAWVAREAGRPQAVRAAAGVLARNPVPLLVPCHRVIRADGRIGDYMFGPEHKEQLLRGEHADLDTLVGYARRGVHFLGSDTTGIVCFPSCHNARRISAAHRQRVPQRRRRGGRGLPPLPQLPARECAAVLEHGWALTTTDHLEER